MDNFIKRCLKDGFDIVSKPFFYIRLSFLSLLNARADVLAKQQKKQCKGDEDDCSCERKGQRLSSCNH